MDKSKLLIFGSLSVFAAILYSANETRKKEASHATPQAIVATGGCDGPYNGYNKQYAEGYERGEGAFRPNGIGAAGGALIQMPAEVWDNTREHACWAAGYDAGYLAAQH